jgi:hypothetical protein
MINSISYFIVLAIANILSLVIGYKLKYLNNEFVKSVKIDLKDFKKYIQSINKRDIFAGVFMCIIAPITEEIIFRNYLKDNLIYFLPYDNLIGGIIFGLMHILNIFFVQNIQIYLHINQFIMTSILGYLLSTINNLYLGMLFHMIYNMLSFLLIILVLNFIELRKDDTCNEIDEWEFNWTKKNGTYINKRRKSYSESIKKELNFIPSIKCRVKYEYLYMYKIKLDKIFKPSDLVQNIKSKAFDTENKIENNFKKEKID